MLFALPLEALLFEFLCYSLDRRQQKEISMSRIPTIPPRKRPMRGRTRTGPKKTTIVEDKAEPPVTPARAEVAQPEVSPEMRVQDMDTIQLKATMKPWAAFMRINRGAVPKEKRILYEACEAELTRRTKK